MLLLFLVPVAIGQEAAAGLSRAMQQILTLIPRLRHRKMGGSENGNMEKESDICQCVVWQHDQHADTGSKDGFLSKTDFWRFFEEHFQRHDRKEVGHLCGLVVGWKSYGQRSQKALRAKT